MNECVVSLVLKMQVKLIFVIKFITFCKMHGSCVIYYSVWWVIVMCTTSMGENVGKECFSGVSA